MAERSQPPGEEASFLRRWSRRKARARRGEEPDPGILSTSDGPEADGEDPEGPQVEDPKGGRTLPEPETVGEDSDVSPFLAPGVDRDLQREALRRLFRSPKFNVVDGLDVYDGDYRSFQSLGEVITAHFRHRAKVAADREARRLAEAASGGEDGPGNGSGPEQGPGGEPEDARGPSDNGGDFRSG